MGLQKPPAVRTSPQISRFRRSGLNLTSISAAQKWLERLNGQFTFEAVKEFGSVVRTEAFCANWSKQSAGLESRLQELDNRAAELQRAIEAAEANPLRNDKLLEDLRKKVAATANRVCGFQRRRGETSRCIRNRAPRDCGCPATRR